MTTQPVAAAPPPPAAARLSWWSFGFALAVTLAIFFLLHPLWRPLDAAAMDRNIAWSYAPIPLLVAGLLLLERKLRWSTWALETLKLTLVKFAITYLFANLMWAFVEPPAAVAAPATAAPSGVTVGRFDLHVPPTPTPLDPAQTARLAGRVLGADGAPRAGVLVSVTAGLEGLVFAAPDVTLDHGEDGLSQRAAIVPLHARLTLRGAADGLHTVRAVDEDGRLLFDFALVAGGERTLMFDRPLGLVRLTCSVHGRSDHGALLAVVASPFAAFTDADGRFEIGGVPKRPLAVSAQSPESPAARVSGNITLGDATGELLLALP